MLGGGALRFKSPLIAGGAALLPTPPPCPAPPRPRLSLLPYIRMESSQLFPHAFTTLYLDDNELALRSWEQTLS